MEPVHRLAPPNSFPTRRHSYRRSAFASSAPVWMVLASLAAGPGDGAAKEGYNVWSKERVHRLHQRVLLEPDNVRVRLLLANAYYEDGETWEAKRELRRALEIKPDYPEAHCNLAVILHAQSSLSEARRHYEAALTGGNSARQNGFKLPRGVGMAGWRFRAVVQPGVDFGRSVLSQLEKPLQTAVPGAPPGGDSHRGGGQPYVRLPIHSDAGVSRPGRRFRSLLLRLA